MEVPDISVSIYDTVFWIQFAMHHKAIHVFISYAKGTKQTWKMYITVVISYCG